MKTYNPNSNPEVGLSTCCNAPTNTIPACFGDPQFTICSHCHTESEMVWKPMYEMISNGHYRKINYELKINK